MESDRKKRRGKKRLGETALFTRKMVRREGERERERTVIEKVRWREDNWALRFKQRSRERPLLIYREREGGERGREGGGGGGGGGAQAVRDRGKEKSLL